MSLFKFGFSTDKESAEKKRKGREESKEKYEKEKRKRQFCTKWLEFDDETNLMYCTPCKKYETTGRFVEGTSNFRIDAIKSHSESTSHFKNKQNFDIKYAKSSVYTLHTGKIDTDRSDKPKAGPSRLEDDSQPAVVGPLDIVIQGLNEEQKQQLIVCFNTAYFIAKEELPFSLYPSLLSLQEKNGVVLPNSYRSDQACRRFMGFIYSEINSQSLAMLKNSNVLSIMFDGATDVSVTENEIVYARFVKEGVPQNVFVKINAVEHAHAEGVLSAIEYAMDSVDPTWNWKEKLIATGSDGASVNLGRRHSVAKLLKDQVPHLFAMHCVSHRLELGAIDAIKQREGKMFEDMKSVIMSLHKDYHYSAKALRELQQLSEALDEKMVKPVNMSGTRWMPHLNKCLDILLNKYCTFVTHFENTLEARSRTVDVQARARLILRHLKDYNLLNYMHFLRDILEILSELSLQFQKDSCGLPEATAALETACLRLTALHQRPGRNLQNFLDTVTEDHTFKGVQLHAPTLTQEQIKLKHDTLIDLVIDHICNRVGDIESDRLLKSMQIFYPINFPETEAERAVYGEESLNELCEHYSVAGFSPGYFEGMLYLGHRGWVREGYPLPRCGEKFAHFTYQLV